MVSFFDDISMKVPEFSNDGWPDEEYALQIWEIMYNKCKVPLKHRFQHKKLSLDNGMNYIRFCLWFAIPNHPTVHDPLNSGEEMWIIRQSDLRCIGRVTKEGKYIRYPQRR